MTKATACRRLLLNPAAAAGSDMEYEEDDLEVDIEEPDQNNF